MDDCKAYPIWQRKLEEDLGGSVSFLAIMLDESVRRDTAVEFPPAYKRFDGEKQKYFK